MRKKLLSIVMMFSIILSLSMSFNTTASAEWISRDWLWPVPASNRLSSCFGDGRNHYAIDIAAPKGSDIIASFSGVVVKTYTNCPNNYPKSGNCPCKSCLNLGNYVYIQHTYNGKNYISRYGHLTDVNVSVGDTVNAGDVIGTVGSTGRSTGYHLDFQIYEGTLSGRVKYIDPLKTPFLQPIEGLNANAASTACCYTYVSELYDIISSEATYKGDCDVTTCEEETHGIIISSTTLRSQPCSASVFSSSMEIGKVSKNEEITVKEIIINTVGEEWLYIKTSSGRYGYIRSESAHVMYVYHGYAKHTLTSSTMAYSQPSYDSSTTAYPAGTMITIVSSVKDMDGVVWYRTKDDKYIPYSSIGSVTYISALSISGAPYPYDSLEEGKSFSIPGSIKSNNIITDISASVINSDGSTVLSKSVYCGATSYSFKGSSLDNGISFGKLDAGMYTYRLTITEVVTDPDANEHSLVTVLESVFSVGSDYSTETVQVKDPTDAVCQFAPESSYSSLASYDKLTISGQNFPGEIELGSSFSIYGTISSGDSNIWVASVYVFDSNGNTVLSAIASPNSTSYNIHNLDNSIRFGSLPAGQYTYVVKAANDSGEATLVSHAFSVTVGNEIAPTPGSFDNFVKVRDYNDKFRDISKNDWYYENVELSYSFGIINGESDTEFEPDSYLTIAECITLASNLHKIYYGTSHEFVLDDEVWYKDYVEYAMDNGIISGTYSDYDAYATRKQVVEILANVFPDGALTAINNITSIPDVSPDSSFASYVYTFYNAGILRGSEADGTFYPDSYILRSEISAILSRIAVPSMRIHFSL